MPSFSEKSEEILSSCHPDLQRLFQEVIKLTDITILEGQRIKAVQDDYFARGLSKLQYPNSKHNRYPSEAVDIEPYPKILVDAKGAHQSLYSPLGARRFYYLAGIVLAVSDHLGIKIRWGGDWNTNQNFEDQTFIDWPHFELVGAT